MRIFLYLSLLICVVACNTKPAELPILSKQHEVDGKMVHDTIPSFSFIDQDSQAVNKSTVAGKAYVTDFFFISCPTICPIMQQNMLSIQNHFLNENKLLLISHTIDPKRDSVARLKQYATSLGAVPDKWHMVTGKKDEIYEIADDYFNVVLEDPTLPDGFDHSGRFILVDQNAHIRAYCNGTDSIAVKAFISSIETLLHDEID